ncbi:SNW/SKI-interacting protein-like [Argentina anserina]|uniref:SNW/SKI-interacting protein-like n=1 Tax=Argentina anserina TaxID=57926 RepID=UPI0021763C2E|nr:SNW/SKI-interacting protein-like [Potentilla anserina]
MAALLHRLPPVKSTTRTFCDHSKDQWFKERLNSNTVTSLILPNKVLHFGDGGAFPEIHRPQYPLGMGKEDTKSSKPQPKVLPVSVDAYGNIAYDAIVKQNENTKRLVFSKHRDLVPKILRNNDEEEKTCSEEELQNEIETTAAETKAALEKIVNVRLSAAQPKSQPKQTQDSKLIKYRPSQTSAAFNSGAKERMIRMMEKPVDPLEPPKFRHKRVPRASEAPPVPVLHSPPRPVSLEDKKDWSIPPCISQFKNNKGYTIPLDKRGGVDGRRLQDDQVSENFAHLQDSLHVTILKCKEELELRANVQRERMEKEQVRRDLELRDIAMRARVEGAAIAAAIPEHNGESTAMDTDETREERKKRDEIRRERERERRLTKNKRSRVTRDNNGDISEKIALGMAATGVGRGSGEEVMYDQRLFNQQKGMDSGFGNDDQYNVYEKRLFTAQSTLSSLYRPKDDDADTYGGADEQLGKIMKTDRFKSHKGFEGTIERAGSIVIPVEFDQEVQEADPFGLDEIMEKMKKAR